MSWKRNYFASGGGGVSPGGGLQGLITTPRTMASFAPSKGLSNEPGQNSCFLNSALQVLWHLDIFRRSFRQLTTHKCMEDSCIFCALKSIFAQFQFSSERVLPSDVLRSALAKTFQDEQRFQLGIMDDAAECFRWRDQSTDRGGERRRGEEEGKGGGGGRWERRRRRKSGEEEGRGGEEEGRGGEEEGRGDGGGERKRGEEEEGEEEEELGEGGRGGVGRRVKTGKGTEDREREKEGGGGSTHTMGLFSGQSLAADPLYSPPALQPPSLPSNCGEVLRIRRLFYRVTEERARQAELYLVGMVCYYGKHYSTFFFQTKIRKWMYFDDAHVKEIGPKWKDVVARCIKGHYQPLLLLYADPRGTPVVTQDNPQLDLLHCSKAGYDSEDSGREPSISSDTRTDSSDSSSRRASLNRPLHQSTGSHLSSESQTAVGGLCWDLRRGPSSGGRCYRPAWRPRREALNIDSIFTRQRGSPLGYSTMPGLPLPSALQHHCPTNMPDLQGAGERAGGLGGMGGDTEGVAGMPGLLGNGTDCPPPPPPLRGAEPQPRLIQRMESGYESSPDREVGQKRVLMTGPSWRSVPKSKSTSAILQELPAPCWGSNNNLAVLSPLHEANARVGLAVAACMRSTGEPITQEQDMEQETGRAILLTPNQEGEEVRPAYQAATLGPGQPPLHSSLPRPSTNSPPAQVEEGKKQQGMRLEELLQVGGVCVRPLSRQLAISLPSLPLGLWDISHTHTHTPPSHTHSYSDPQHTHPPPSRTNPEHPHTHSDRLPTPRSYRSQPHPSPSTASPHWPDQGSAANTVTRHWSSWSLDRPDAVVTPYDTPPDRRLSVRPHLPYRNYNSQPAPRQHDPCDPQEAGLSELDFLYRASLQAGSRGWPARSLTPNANVEMSVYRTDCSSTIGRSLSGTIINPRRHRLTATRSFVNQTDVRASASYLISSETLYCYSIIIIFIIIITITPVLPYLHSGNVDVTPYPSPLGPVRHSVLFLPLQEMPNGAGSFWCLTGVKLSSDH
ncbi:unnamed protein product [Coregonus sp. 'balchen']|nr:unnamed protein product [Coregonus sp. 'balchen']